MRSPHTIVSIMSEGNIHRLVDRQRLAHAVEEGQHRPVAVGETLRRLAVEALLATVAKDTTVCLQPSQLGFGTQNGCQPSYTPSQNGSTTARTETGAS